MLTAYNIALAAASPIARAVLASRPRYRPLLGRFAPKISVSGRPLWIHACSVGEVAVAATFIHALRLHAPHLAPLLTVSTVSGRKRAEELFKAEIPIAWFPFDRLSIVRKFFDQANPCALILVETELWPNVLHEARARAVPVALINGRISDKHFQRYRRIRSLIAPALQGLTLAAMQTSEYARRIVVLGAQMPIAQTTGNIKFDSTPRLSPGAQYDMRPVLGVPESATLVVFGSTRPGDESLARCCWDSLSSTIPELWFVIAPRHIERASAAAAPFNNVPVIRRSEMLASRKPDGARVIILDSLGELNQVYRSASVAVIGGSFTSDVQGHNPIEPAAQGVPVLFGPRMRNFQDAADALISAGAAVQTTAADLAANLKRILEDPALQAQMGRCAKEAVAAQSGALERTLALLQPILNRCGSAASNHKS